VDQTDQGLGDVWREKSFGQRLKFGTGGGGKFVPLGTRTIFRDRLGMQFKWKNFLLFCVRFLAPKQIIFSPYEKALTSICRGLEGCIARISGRVRMGHTKARRNLDAAGRAGLPDRIVITFSELIVLMLTFLI